jgi:hypothetical protein
VQIEFPYTTSSPIRMHPDPSENPCRQIDLCRSFSYDHPWQHPVAQCDMWDEDCEPFLTHDRRLWWSGGVYDKAFTMRDGSYHSEFLGLAMAIVKQDREEVDWDTNAMHHEPDLVDVYDNFNEYGPAVESVKPGWREEMLEPEGFVISVEYNITPFTPEEHDATRH